MPEPGALAFGVLSRFNDHAFDGGISCARTATVEGLTHHAVATG
jgi:hypothetical protein